MAAHAATATSAISIKSVKGMHKGKSFLFVGTGCPYVRATINFIGDALEAHPG
jgi:hypothetical protein